MIGYFLNGHGVFVNQPDDVPAAFISQKLESGQFPVRVPVFFFIGVAQGELDAHTHVKAYNPLFLGVGTQGIAGAHPP